MCLLNSHKIKRKYLRSEHFIYWLFVKLSAKFVIWSAGFEFLKYIKINNLTSEVYSLNRKNVIRISKIGNLQIIRKRLEKLKYLKFSVPFPKYEKINLNLNPPDQLFFGLSTFFHTAQNIYSAAQNYRN